MGIFFGGGEGGEGVSHNVHFALVIIFYRGEMYQYQGHEKCLLSICFALFVANNAYKSFRCAKSVTCLDLYSRKLFLITLPLLFKKCVE